MVKHSTFNILFVCRHNKFRSKFAEAYFDKINKNPQIVAKSAGIFPDEHPMNPNEVKAAKKFGVKLNGKARPVTTDLLRWNDLLILITNDIVSPKKLFNYEHFKSRVIVWKIKDDLTGSDKEIESRLKKVSKRVNNLNKSLEKMNKNIDEKLKKKNVKKSNKKISSY